MSPSTAFRDCRAGLGAPISVRSQPSLLHAAGTPRKWTRPFIPFYLDAVPTTRASGAKHRIYSHPVTGFAAWLSPGDEGDGLSVGVDELATGGQHVSLVERAERQPRRGRCVLGGAVGVLQRRELVLPQYLPHREVPAAGNAVVRLLFSFRTKHSVLQPQKARLVKISSFSCYFRFKVTRVKIRYSCRAHRDNLIPINDRHEVYQYMTINLIPYHTKSNRPELT